MFSLQCLTHPSVCLSGVPKLEYGVRALSRPPTSASRQLVTFTNQLAGRIILDSPQLVKREREGEIFKVYHLKWVRIEPLVVEFIEALIFQLFFLSRNSKHIFLFFSFIFALISFSRNAYRAEVASFLVPVLGESPSNSRIRERIEFISNLLFLLEDLYLTIGHGFMVNQSSVKINVRSSLYWARNQLADKLKELMIAKKTGWQVLKNFKNQVMNIFLLFLFFTGL